MRKRERKKDYDAPTIATRRHLQIPVAPACGLPVRSPHHSRAPSHCVRSNLASRSSAFPSLSLSLSLSVLPCSTLGYSRSFSYLHRSPSLFVPRSLSLSRRLPFSRSRFFMSKPNLTISLSLARARVPSLRSRPPPLPPRHSIISFSFPRVLPPRRVSIAP